MDADKPLSVKQLGRFPAIICLTPSTFLACEFRKTCYDSSMKAGMKRFDAVAESRKRKEAVAKETGGMTPEETAACFNRGAAYRRFEIALRRVKQVDDTAPKKAKK